jgi:hypothetical protein
MIWCDLGGRERRACARRCDCFLIWSARITSSCTHSTGVSLSLFFLVLHPLMIVRPSSDGDDIDICTGPVLWAAALGALAFGPCVWPGQNWERCSRLFPSFGRRHTHYHNPKPPPQQAGLQTWGSHCRLGSQCLLICTHTPFKVLRCIGGTRAHLISRSCSHAFSLPFSLHVSLLFRRLSVVSTLLYKGV